MRPLLGWTGWDSILFRPFSFVNGLGTGSKKDILVNLKLGAMCRRVEDARPCLT